MADASSAVHPFSTRRALMPMWGQNPLAPSQWPERWSQLQAAALPEQALAYVHIPFCANHCVFCGFYRNGWNPESARRYTDRLIAELEADAARRAPGGSIQALYLGGGTPTLLAAEDLARLLDALRATLPLSDDCEITVEGRISHFTPEKVDACLASGANRFSIGVQTFDSAIRRRLGRKHPGDEAADYLAWLAAYSGQVVVADLIFGLPGQSEAIWRRDLEIALGLGLAGLDVYAFNLMPQLPIVRMIEKGAFPPAPGLAEQLQQYRIACQLFADAGWAQLSNSHFGTPDGGERNRYNLAIKSGASCLAFGAGAGGNLAGISYALEPDLARYLETPPAQKPLARMACAATGKHWLPVLQGEIETGRFRLAALPRPELTLPLLQHWAGQGLLLLDGTYARLTTEGRFWGPTMMRHLADTLQPDNHAGHTVALHPHCTRKETV
ncbi:heme anaerobic degradation radical SAM methyltransferase ChuW/HutW [Craterilacuibacter sp. RT1T]|uniref:heme anaerobic degradation radical SAM methyltransferase ChuW/HutW n=1 Tax=Craterilacuibacter sp. RT1T TaxID=2942211 RepID=UPI0020BEB301|nr:heme anaerobic degradation radical SAM methyltransferase ChuW/HutW [Craterilacuibacter sp. RT1T]MCL6262369.1 heme anaerobic degradation radical SAM methyltransferase ChuW/HutW [Craterilacuibacter sp. RT1T]